MKNIKGILPIVIILAIVVVGGFYFYSKKSDSTKISVKDSSKTDVYKNEKYGFEIEYPSGFTFRNTTDTSWRIEKINSEQKPQTDRFLQPSDVSVGVSILDRQAITSSVVQAVEGRYNRPSMTQTVVGEKTMKVTRSIPGMGAPGDEYIWLEPSGKYILIFNVNPSNTEYLAEAEAVIASFKFVK